MEDKFCKIVTGVLAIIQNSKKEILFIKQKKGPYAGNWLLPGGSIEKSETCDRAVKREVYEETSINIKNPQFLNVYEIFGEWNEKKYHVLMFVYKDFTDDKIPSDFQGDNVDDIRWISLDKAELHSTNKLILTDAQITDISQEEIRQSLDADKVFMNKL